MHSVEQVVGHDAFVFLGGMCAGVMIGCLLALIIIGESLIKS